MFEKVNVPILGLVENMAQHVQQLRPCGAYLWRRWRQEDGGRVRHRLPGRAAAGAADPRQADSGRPTVVADPDGEVAQIYKHVAREVAVKIALKSKKDFFVQVPHHLGEQEHLTAPRCKAGGMMPAMSQSSGSAGARQRAAGTSSFLSWAGARCGATCARRRAAAVDGRRHAGRGGADLGGLLPIACRAGWRATPMQLLGGDAVVNQRQPHAGGVCATGAHAGPGERHHAELSHHGPRQTPRAAPAAWWRSRAWRPATRCAAMCRSPTTRSARQPCAGHTGAGRGLGGRALARLAGAAAGRLPAAG